jgi:hypothetical protein
LGILTYIKIGASVLVIALAAYFYLDYQHRGKVIAAQKIVIEQHELAEKYYAAQPKIDERTKEIKDDIKKATDTGDIDRLNELYSRLRKHQSSSSKGKTPRKTRNE